MVSVTQYAGLSLRNNRRRSTVILDQSGVFNPAESLEYVPKGRGKRNVRIQPAPFDLSPRITPRAISSARDIPVTNCKYKAVWQRIRVKIRSKLYLQKLFHEIKLYGANTVTGNEDVTSGHEDFLLKKIQQADQLTEKAQIEQTGGLLIPGTPAKLGWGVVYLIIMLYTALIMPFRLAFLTTIDDSTWFWVEVTIDVLFFIDILVTLNSAFFDSTGSLVLSRKIIFLHYLKTWLLVDLAACLPVYLFDGDSDIDSASSGGQFKSFLRLARLPRLYRLLRITRLFKFAKRFKENDWFQQIQDLSWMRPSTIRLTGFVLSVLLGAHIMTCIWYFLAKAEDLGPETWVSQRGFQDASVGDLYIASLFWTITTLATVGYGDIVPNTSLERLAAMVWMCIGVCFFSFTIGSLATMLNSIDSQESVLRNRLSAMDEFAKEAKLDTSLRDRLRHALRYSTGQTGFTSSDKRLTFNELPRQLRYEVSMAMHNGAAKSIPFFAERDQVFLASVIPFLHSVFVPATNVVYQENDYAEEIYFIASGRCVLLLHNQHVIKRLQTGSYFGEIEMIVQTSRKHTVKTASDSELLTMSKHVLMVIKSEFPSVYEEMVEIADIRNQLNEKAKMQFTKLLNLYQSGELKSDDEISKQLTPHKAPTQKFSECASDTNLRSMTLSRAVSANDSQLGPQVHDLDTHVTQLESDLDTTRKLLVLIANSLKDSGVPIIVEEMQGEGLLQDHVEGERESMEFA